MESQYQERIGDKIYKVYFDTNFRLRDHMDFESDDEFNALQKQLDDGDLTVYGVIEYSVCECCSALKDDLGSLWGLICEYPKQALQEYLAHMY